MTEESKPQEDDEVDEEHLEKKPSKKKQAKKSEDALEDGQLDDVAGGIDTVPLPERTPGTYDRVVKKTTFSKPRY